MNTVEQHAADEVASGVMMTDEMAEMFIADDTGESDASEARGRASRSPSPSSSEVSSQVGAGDF